MSFRAVRDRRRVGAGLFPPDPYYSAMPRNRVCAKRYLKKNVKGLAGAGVGYCHELIILAGTLPMLFLAMP